MATYLVKSKSTNDLYLCQNKEAQWKDGEISCVRIKDRYSYTIPVADLEIILISDERGIR